jgi:hypothetical protein
MPDDASVPDDSDDLKECARAMVKRHGASAYNVALLFASAQRWAGSDEMATFWNAVAQAIQKLGAGMS